MLWKNKGHEFDEFKDVFRGKRIWIYGAGCLGQELCRRLSFVDCVEGFIDRDENKQKNGVMGMKCISLYDFMDVRKDNVIVVVATTNMEYAGFFHHQLIRIGYREGYNIFDYLVFRDFYMRLYLWFAFQKLYMHTSSLLTTTVCNLNCVGCLNYEYANKNKHHFNLDKIKRDMDTYFKYFDYIYRISLSGGEALLHPDLEEILKYVARYNSQYNHIVVPTNGLTIPSDEACRLLKSIPVIFQIDDYRETVPGSKKTIPMLIEKLQRYGIQYELNYVKNWIELKREKTESSEIMIAKRFDACCHPFTIATEGRFTNCQYMQFAHHAGVADAEENDYFLPNNNNLEGKTELLEYISGFSEKGYTSHCSQCGGWWSINQNIIPSAVQFE